MCKIEGCSDPIHYKKLELCQACYAGLSYWAGRPVKDKRERLEKIKRLDHRMQYMVDGGTATKEPKIVHFPKRTPDAKSRKRRSS